MTRMKAGLFALPVLALALMGQACPDQDAKVQSTLASWCPAIDTAYAHYTPVRRFASASLQGPADTAFAEFQMLCDGRATATTQTILAKAVFAGEAIYNAIRSARGNGAAVAYAGDLNKLEGMLDKIRNEVR